MTEPTRNQCDDAKRVQDAMLQEASLLASEGVGPHEMLAGMGAAIASVIATAWGQEHVARWFTSQADMLNKIGGGN